MTMQLETKITVRFLSDVPCTTVEEQVFMDSLNAHAGEIAESLQGAMRLLVIEMLGMKRKTFNKEAVNARPKHTEISPND